MHSDELAEEDSIIRGNNIFDLVFQQFICRQLQRIQISDEHRLKEAIKM